MISRKNRSSSVALGAASFAALCLASGGAEAADCFDRDTSDPKAGNATAVAGPEVGLQQASAEDFARPDAGQDVFTGDRVRTGEASHLQLKLCDWSTYTFSPNSESEINEFYSADGARRRRVVNFFRGGFRVASGRNTEPDSTEVRIQESGVTMGVRGTSVLMVELDGVVYALLEGPIQDNTAYEPRGETSFWTEDNRDTIIASLRRPGWVVTVGPDGVSRPFRADADLLRRIYEAFVPVVPDDDGEATDYQMSGDPEDDSGQGTQQGGEGSNYANNDSQRESDDTTTQPEQGCGSTIPIDECQEQAFPISVGDILPLDALEEFAAAQGLMPDGHVLALARAELFQDDGSGPQLVEDGITILQIHVDWASRTIAPEALASFVQFDQTSDINDLSVFDPTPFQIPTEFFNAYAVAESNSIGIPFASGISNLAVFDVPLFVFTIRKGAGDTVTIDVDVDFSAQDGAGDTFNLVSTFRDLLLAPGPGELAFGLLNLSQNMSVADLDAAGMSRGPTALLTSASSLTPTIFAIDAPVLLDGVSYAQMEINFSNRTVGGPNSFFATTVAPDPAFGDVKLFEYIPFDQPQSFDIGLFGETLYPLPRLTSDPALRQGQTQFADGDGILGILTAILDVGDSNRLYTQILALENFNPPLPLSTIAGLEGLTGTLGAATFRFDSTADVSGINDLSQFNGVAGGGTGSAEAQIDINFANRTLGGGNSYVAVDIDVTFPAVFSFSFSELLNAVSFDDAADGVGVFAFDGSDFSGSDMENMLMLIRDGSGGPGETADIYIGFSDAGVGDGHGQITGMPLQQGATSAPMP